MEEQTNVILNDQALIINFTPGIESNEGIKNYKLLVRNKTIGGDPTVKLEVVNEDEEPVLVNGVQYSILEGDEFGEFLSFESSFLLDFENEENKILEEVMLENETFLQDEEGLTIKFRMEIVGEDDGVEFEITAENDFSEAA